MTALLLEALLGDQQQGPCPHLKPALLDELALEGGAGGLIELNVPAGEVEVAGGDIAAEKSLAIAQQQAAGDDFNVWLRHGFTVVRFLNGQAAADGER